MDAGNREGDGGDGEDAEGTWWWEKEKDAKVDGKHPELRYRSIRRPGSKPDVIPISHSGNFRFCIFCSFRLSCEETWKKREIREREMKVPTEKHIPRFSPRSVLFSMEEPALHELCPAEVIAIPRDIGSPATTPRSSARMQIHWLWSQNWQERKKIMLRIKWKYT